MDSIFLQINNQAESLTEKDLEWIVPALLGQFYGKLKKLSIQVYKTNNKTAFPAFQELAREQIKKATSTFLFDQQHWKTGRDLNSYLLTTLNHLASNIGNDADSTKTHKALICPACRLFNGRKELLIPEDTLWRCRTCTKNFEREPNGPQARIQQAFSLHSRAGFRCPDCSQFIPESLLQEQGLVCPYLNCIYFGSGKILLEEMNHPIRIMPRTMLSLQAKLGDDDTEFLQLLPAEMISVDDKIIIKETYERDLQILTTVLDEQIEAVKRINHQATLIQKLLMYQAFKNMTELFPQEMVGYLVHLKQNGSTFPIQPRIFQEYTSLIEGYLPFTIFKNNEKFDISSMTDPNLGLFLGISKFSATVRDDLTIPNLTIETYIGGRKNIDYGSCFIGRIINIFDKTTGESVKTKIKFYSFSDITMENIKPGTEVEVTHFRIPSHYEMNNMTFLQRARRSIVDSIYFRLNKTKREIK